VVWVFRVSVPRTSDSNHPLPATTPTNQTLEWLIIEFMVCVVEAMVRWADWAQDEPLETYIPNNYLTDPLCDGDSSSTIEYDGSQSQTRRASSSLSGFGGPMASPYQPSCSYISRHQQALHPNRRSSNASTGSLVPQLQSRDQVSGSMEVSISLFDSTTLLESQSAFPSGSGHSRGSSRGKAMTAANRRRNHRCNATGLGYLDESSSGWGESLGGSSFGMSSSYIIPESNFKGTSAPRPSLNRFESNQSFTVDHLVDAPGSPMRSNFGMLTHSSAHGDCSVSSYSLLAPHVAGSTTELMNCTIGGRGPLVYSDSFLHDSTEISDSHDSFASPPSSPFGIPESAHPARISPPPRSPRRAAAGGTRPMSPLQRRPFQPTSPQRSRQRNRSPPPPGGSIRGMPSFASSMEEFSWRRIMIHSTEEGSEDGTEDERSNTSESVDSGDSLPGDETQPVTPRDIAHGHDLAENIVSDTASRADLVEDPIVDEMQVHNSSTRDSDGNTIERLEGETLVQI
jgi:hypothetical protein